MRPRAPSRAGAPSGACRRRPSGLVSLARGCRPSLGGRRQTRSPKGQHVPDVDEPLPARMGAPVPPCSIAALRGDEQRGPLGPQGAPARRPTLGPPDELRLVRVVQVLGLSNDPEAKKALAEWAAGAAGATLTEEAKMSLRVHRHSVGSPPGGAGQVRGDGVDRNEAGFEDDGPRPEDASAVPADGGLQAGGERRWPAGRHTGHVRRLDVREGREGCFRQARGRVSEGRPWRT